MTYQTALIARFGKKPTPQQLAKLENKAMRETMGNYRMGDRETIRKDFLANRTRMAMLDAITEPMTARQITEACGQPKSNVLQAIARGVQAGLIRRHSHTDQHVTIWERVCLADSNV